VIDAARAVLDLRDGLRAAALIRALAEAALLDADGIGDQVPHEHSKRATYWLRNAREP
jgi:hypothetical protein